MMLTADDARALTDSIRADLGSAVAKLQQAREQGAHTALGYDTWHGFVIAELGDLLRELHLPKIERQALVASMTGAGETVREISEKLPVSKSTVQNDRRELGIGGKLVNLDDHRQPVVSPPPAGALADAQDPAAPRPSSIDLIVAAVARARDGYTVHEAARRLHWRQGQTSCALSRAEKRGRLARTGRFRGGCAVYAVPAVAVDSAA